MHTHPQTCRVAKPALSACTRAAHRTRWTGGLVRGRTCRRATAARVQAQAEPPQRRQPSQQQAMGGLSFNLLDQLAFYGAYHNNKWNQLIHFIFVPAIMWSAGVWLAGSGPLLPTPPALLQSASALLPPWLASGLQVNATCLAVLAYSLYYMALEPVAGLSWAAAVGLPLWLTASAFTGSVAHAGLWAAGVHVLSWYMQIHPGHGILEGRKPALLDSLVQALTLAPLFVWFELLFLLGYRRDLYRKLQARVAADIAAFRKQQQQQQRGGKHA